MLFKLMCRGGVGGGGTMSLDVCSLCNLWEIFKTQFYVLLRNQ